MKTDENQKNKMRTPIRKMDVSMSRMKDKIMSVIKH